VFPDGDQFAQSLSGSDSIGTGKAPALWFDAFSSREPVSTSRENALATPSRRALRQLRRKFSARTEPRWDDVNVYFSLMTTTRERVRREDHPLADNSIPAGFPGSGKFPM
jgi:hypothetical protein